MKDNVYMGIDASSTCTGVSVFEDGKLVYYTAIRPKGENWRDRMFHEGSDLSNIMQRYEPCKIFMEDVPNNPSGGLKTAMVLGGVQGFIYGVASNHNIPIEFVLPTTWRSNIGLFDGTKEGKKREVLKQKAIKMANEKFGLELLWVSPNSKKNDDDIAEAILICASMLNIVTKERKFGRIAKSHSIK